MPYNTVKIKGDLEGKPIPQYFDEDKDSYEVVKGTAGGTSSHALGSIVHDTWEGNTNTSKSLSRLCVGFSLKNDGSGDVTVKIGNLTFKVKGGESFNGNFEPFSKVEITTTSAYRALVAR